MNKALAILKSTFAFGYVGAWLGGFTSYVFEYWGSHGVMWSSFLDAQARLMAWEAFISNVQKAFITGLPAALLAGLLLSAVAVLLRGKPGCIGWPVWPLLGGSAGAVAAFAFFGGRYGMGHPVASGLVGGAFAALLLSRWLSAWLWPVPLAALPP